MMRRTESERYSEFCRLEAEKMIAELREMRWGDSISQNFVKQSVPRLNTVAAISEEYARYSRTPMLRELAQSLSLEARDYADALQMIGDCCIKLGNSRAELDAYLRGATELAEGLFADVGSGGESRGDCLYIGLVLRLTEELAELSGLALNFELCQDLVPVLEEIVSGRESAAERLRDAGRVLGC